MTGGVFRPGEKRDRGSPEGGGTGTCPQEAVPAAGVTGRTDSGTFFPRRHDNGDSSS